MVKSFLQIFLPASWNCVSICSVLFSACINTVGAQNKACISQNTATCAGEIITYKISYNVGNLWIGAGEVTFEVKLETYRKRPVYHIISTGKTYKSYDWFFKVRDCYETYCDTSTLLPLRFKRRVREGDYTLNLQYVFNNAHSRAYAFYKKKDNPLVKDTIQVTGCTYDVLSIIYCARNIDFKSAGPGDTIPITIILDNKVSHLYIRYLGKEMLQTEKMGKFRCITFSPLLVEGTIFKEGESMKVWVTDDRNKVPIYVETPIIVGSIQAKLKSWKGLRNKAGSRMQ